MQATSFSIRSLVFSTVISTTVACGPTASPQKPVVHKKASTTPEPAKAEGKVAVAKKGKADSEISGDHVFLVDAQASEVGFTMDAPFEKIRGRVPKSAVSGRLSIDPAHVDQTTGTVKVSIADLELFQRKGDGDGEFGEETKNATQNEHARNWLEISEDAPAAQRGKNQRVAFTITRIDKLDHADVTKLTGATREVNFVAVGEFDLHQMSAETRVAMKAVFHYEGDELKRVGVESTKPFGVDLAKHEVKPRTAFGKLAQKTLSAMSPKVAQVADVSVRLQAKPHRP